MGRAPCCATEGLRKGPWSAKEDLLLTNYIKEHGEGQWRNLPKKAGLLRCGKSCRLRWMNYLRPGIKRGNFSQDEEDLIVRMHSLLGNRWSLIAGRLPGRTDNEIKNYWNTHLIKKLKTAGIQPKINNTSSKLCSKKKPRKEKPRKKQDKNKKKKQIKKDTPQLVFVPKPIRVSSSLPRNCSIEDIALTSSTSTSSEEADHDNNNINDNNSIPFISCDPNLFDDGFLDLSPKWSVPTNESMLEKVYEEYLQLLSEKCYLLDDPNLAEDVSL